MLEVVELSEEAGEESIVRILLQSMVHEPESEDELTGVFVAELLFLSGKLCKCGEVMVAAEVEVEHFLDFTVHYLSEVYVVGTFLFVLITHNCNSFNRMTAFRAVDFPNAGKRQYVLLHRKALTGVNVHP